MGRSTKHTERKGSSISRNRKVFHEEFIVPEREIPSFLIHCWQFQEASIELERETQSFSIHCWLFQEAFTELERETLAPEFTFSCTWRYSSCWKTKLRTFELFIGSPRRYPSSWKEKLRAFELTFGRPRRHSQSWLRRKVRKRNIHFPKHPSIFCKQTTTSVFYFILLPKIVNIKKHVLFQME